MILLIVLNLWINWKIVNIFERSNDKWRSTSGHPGTYFHNPSYFVTQIWTRYSVWYFVKLGSCWDATIWTIWTCFAWIYFQPKKNIKKDLKNTIREKKYKIWIKKIKKYVIFHTLVGWVGLKKSFSIKIKIKNMV